ncbi:hypothetical protein ACP70R_021464 [Stipagrostis hirtigluma subsp. patula]
MCMTPRLAMILSMDLVSMLADHTSFAVTLLCLFVATTALLLHLRVAASAASVLSELAVAVQVLARQRAPGGLGTRRGLSIQVTDHAVAHSVLVRHSAAFLEHPATATPSTIISRNLHHNIFSAAYGAYWRATRRNMVAGVLHQPRVRLLFRETRRRALAGLVRALASGAPASESVHFAVYRVVAEMCFGKDVVAGKVGEAGLRAMQKLQRDMLLALPSFTAVVLYPRIGKLLYPSRWRKLLAFRRRQEETFLPLVAEVRNNRKKESHDGTLTSYVESLLDLRIHEQGGRGVTDGELVSLISEFLGNGSDSTAASVEWTMANLVKNPEMQQKLRHEVNTIAGDNDDDAVVEEEDLSRMPYLRAVVLESLRRHPTVPFVMRHVEGEEAAKALGVARLPRGGATVNFLVGKMSRDLAVWSDPMSFSPERFMPGGEGELADLTCNREIKMMPFGAGRRMCPGMAVAILHLEYFVANLVREFQWSEVEGEEVDLTEFHGFPFTAMKRPLRARLVPRDVLATASE